MIYFDNSATTACLKEAADIMVEVLTTNFGNPSSLHNFGYMGENYIKSARTAIAKTLKCQDKEIYFTSGGTESNNIAISGAVNAKKRLGNKIITLQIEHASVYEPFKALEKAGYEVVYLPVDSNGIVDMKALEEELSDDVILVSTMMVNNEIGSLQPVEQMGKMIHKLSKNAIYHVDAIQAYGKMPIIPKNMGIDLLSVSGHKIHGPKGSGFLYIKDGVRVVPIVLGGGQEGGMRSGTENVPAIAGLGVASEYAYKNLEANREHMYNLRSRLIEGLLKIDGVSINGPLDNSGAPHIVSVSTKGVRAEVLLHSLEEKNIYVSAGSACSSNKPAISRTLKSIGLDTALLDATVRFSFCPENTIEEVDEAIAAMAEIIPNRQRFTRR